MKILLYCGLIMGIILTYNLVENSPHKMGPVTRWPMKESIICFSGVEYIETRGRYDDSKVVHFNTDGSIRKCNFTERIYLYRNLETGEIEQ